MIPINVKGKFIVVSNALAIKKHPIGTPALPIAATVATTIHTHFSIKVKLKPWLSPTNSTVIKMNAAQAFILMLVHKGKLKRATLGFTFNPCSAQSIAVGIAALEDFEKKANEIAGSILENACM